MNKQYYVDCLEEECDIDIAERLAFRLDKLETEYSAEIINIQIVSQNNKFVAFITYKADL